MQLVETNMLFFQIKNSIRDAQITQPWEESKNSMRLDVKCTLCTLKKHLPKYYVRVQHCRVKFIGNIGVRL